MFNRNMCSPKNHQVIQSYLFGMVKTWPFQGLSDLHLGNQKVTLKSLNHLTQGVFVDSLIYQSMKQGCTMHPDWLKWPKAAVLFDLACFMNPLCARVDPLPYIGDGLPTSNRGTLYTLTIGWITIPYEAYNGEFGPHILLCWNRTPLPCLDVSAPPRRHQCWPHQFHSQSLPTSVVNASMLLAKWNNISPTFGFSWNSRKFPLLNHHHFGVAQKPRVWGRDLIIWLEMVGWCHWFRDYAA